MKKIFSTILALTMIAVLAVAVSAAMFTDADSYAKFEMTGEPVYAMDDEFDEYWTGNWDSMGDNGDEVTVELVDGVGYNGTKGISVSSAGTSNVGLYLYATEKNGIAKDYTGAQYLRVWMDLTNVSFRKANFGVVDSMFCLFSTDEVDGAWECPFYYSADGANWTEMFHGGDGCLGDAQDSDVFGLKGWFAFPTKDFTIRGNANWEAYDELTPCNVADVQAVYLFWDYSDNAIDNQGQAFILDNIEFVADYKAFDYEVVAAEGAAPAAAYAADSAFVNQDVLNAEYWDDPETLELGGSGQPIQYVDGYGVGYSSLNDQVIYNELDFGENGADKFIINFSFGKDGYTGLINLYIDEKSGTPAATLEIPVTGGWEATFAQEFEAAVTVPGGKHNVIVEFGNEHSGSFTYIRFNEAAPAADAEAPAAAAPATTITADEGRELIVVPEAAAAPTLDTTKEDCYGETYKFDAVYAGKDSIDADISFCWNGNTLYGFMNVADTTPFTNYGSYYNGDNIEMYFDLDNAKPDTLDENHFRFRILPEDQDIVFDTSECTSGYEVNYTNYVKWTDKGYTLEFAYEIPTGITADSVIGYDVGLCDGNEEAGARTGYIFLGSNSDQQWKMASANGCTMAFISAPVTFGVQDSTGSFDGEAAANLFDGDETTKWCFDSTAFTEPYVIWNVENALNVTGYEIVTANDNADYTGRNPGAWTLSGSADGESWTVIADVAEDKVLEDVNFTPFTFAADVAGEYSWFKFEIKNVVGGGVCQISGLNLLTGDVTPSAAPAVEEAEVVEEAPAEEAAPAEEEVAAPAEETVEEAAQTFDFVVIGAIAAIVSAAGYAVAKKR